MGKLSAAYQRAKRRLDRAENPPPKEEDRALRILQREARRQGCLLKSDGEGGIASSKVLGVFRRDAVTDPVTGEKRFACKVCGEKGTKANGGLGLHHRGGIVTSKKMSREGHNNKGLITICDRCHNRLHDEAREEGIDSSQVTPEGDKGTRRDKGLPDAHPTH